MKSLVGLGNSLVDILVRLDSEELLQELSLPKGSMQLVDGPTQGKIGAAISHFQQQLVSGGSAGNTVRGMAELGVQVGFLGKVGRDATGSFFEAELRRCKVEPLLLTGENPSGRCISLITPDSERTMATYLGASIEMTQGDIGATLFAGYDFLHIEGYLVQNHDLIRTAIVTAKEAGLEVSLDLASFNVVEENLDFLHEMVTRYVDVVFANEEEARAFTGVEAAEAVSKIAQLCKIAVVKVGSKGSLIQAGDVCYKIGARPAQPVDTTGAGDLFAAGFLYGLCRELPLDRCGEIGALVASRVIEVVGTRLESPVWAAIRDEVDRIERA